jgi:crotonobetainyl-CoA:carnitine CoA-transferase CaiB-like acyl-CoA transferase
VERADVFLTNFLPDARERLRMTYDDLRRVNPRLVYAKGHGQGARGPDARRGGYDGVSFWARGGDCRPPVVARPALRETSGRRSATSSADVHRGRRRRSALPARAERRRGSRSTSRSSGVAMWVLSPDIVAAQMYGHMLPTAGEMRMIPNPLVGNYECRTGRRSSS